MTENSLPDSEKERDMNRFKVTELGSLVYGISNAKIGFRQIFERKSRYLDAIKRLKSASL